MMRKTQARTCEDSLDTPVHADGQKYRREARSLQSPDSPLPLPTTGVRSSRQFSSSDSSDEANINVEEDGESDQFISAPSSPGPVSSVVLTPAPASPLGCPA